MALDPHELLLEDQRQVAAFLRTRLDVAHRVPSRNAVHDLLLALQVGHRRAQRGLSLVFEGTEDAVLKRNVLEQYAGLDRLLDEAQQHHDQEHHPSMLAAALALTERIDGGFQFASLHLDSVRAQLPEVTSTDSTRPSSPPPDLDANTTAVWFDDFDEDAQTQRYVVRDPTRRGH